MPLLEHIPSSAISHKLPFSISTLTSSFLLQIIFSDVWTSLIYSIDNFKYYVVFVYHFTKYIFGFILLNVNLIFMMFSFDFNQLSKNSLIRKYFECHHHHIVEIGLSLLSHSSRPLLYQSYVFATAVYLTNCMPTPTLQFSSLYLTLFQSSPNYSKLRVFWCLCYPLLHSYSSHKNVPCSAPCVFLGYSLTQSVYLCLEPSSKIHISFHNKFVENALLSMF